MYVSDLIYNLICLRNLAFDCVCVCTKCGVKMSFMHAKYAFYGFCMVFHTQHFDIIYKMLYHFRFAICNRMHFQVDAKSGNFFDDRPYSIRMRIDLYDSHNQWFSQTMCHRAVAKLFRSVHTHTHIV